MSCLSAKKGARRGAAYGGGAALLLLAGARQFPAGAEWYAAHIFPVFPHTVGRIFSLVPFSGLEVLLGASALLLTGALISWLRRCWRPRLEPRQALRFRGVYLCYIIAGAALWFALTCGVNYSRDTFLRRVPGIEVSAFSAPTGQITAERLLALGALLAEQVDLTARELADEPAFDFSRAELTRSSRQALAALNERYGGLLSFYPRPKPVLFSPLMSALNLTGVYSCFTLEANYNRDIPVAGLPFTICQELAHLSGYIREEEANLVAYLACRESPAATFRYSADYSALGYVLNALFAALPAEDYQEFYAALPERVRADFQTSRSYWQQFAGPVAEVYEQVNDAYLKANAQADGVASYDRLVDLLLCYYRL
jgi:hypothetical protein